MSLSRSLVRSISQGLSLSTGDHSAGGGRFIYASSTATGDNDGTSWDNAFTSLSDAIDEMEDGAVLFTDAPESSPFLGGYTVSGLSGFSIITNAGPSGETWFTDGRSSSSWFDAGGGIFTLVLGAKPTHVAYDFKADDSAGTVTGANVSAAVYAEALSRVEQDTQFDASEVVAWYGLLTENTGTPTTPGNGEWGYSGGTLYVNPPGSPSLANVNELARYIPGGVNALTCNSCDNFSVSGRMIGLLYPDDTSNTGYILKGHSVTNATLAGVKAIASGYHAVGIAGSSGGGGSISDCLSLTLESAIPYVFYTDSHLPNAGHVGRGLVTLGCPLLRHDGRALTETSSSPNPCYSHTSGGAVRLGGILWDKLVLIDVSSEILTPTGTAMPTPGQTSLNGIASAADVPDITDFQSIDSYSINCTDSIAVGVNALPMPQVSFVDCVFNRAGFGVNSQPAMAASTGGADLRWFVKSSTIYTGDFDIRYFGAIEVGDGVHLEDNTITVQSTDTAGTAGLLSPQNDVTGDLVISLHGNVVNYETSGADCVVKLGNPTSWNGPYGFIESDGNTFNGIENSFRHNNDGVAPKDADWWYTNVSETDVFVVDN